MTNWLGKWELIPELSHYSVGGPPESGIYEISQDGELIRLQIDWVAEGQPMSTGFAAHPDGRQMPSDFPGVDSFSVLADDDNTLSGDAMAGGQVVSTAVRRVSGDGSLLSVLQKNALPQTGDMTIFQVYRRIA